MLPHGERLTLQGIDKGSRATGEVFDVEVQKLLGVGGYGAAFLVEMICHTPAAEPAATAAGGKAKEVVLPKQLVLKVSLPESVVRCKQQHMKGMEQQQPQQQKEQQQQLEGEQTHPEDEYAAWQHMCSCSWRKEFDVMRKCFPSNSVLGCYGRGRLVIGTGGEQEWLLLEYARYGTLEEQLVGPEGQPQGLGPEEAREVIQDVLEGLALASHKAHAIHRDIKPANIMLCETRNARANSPRLSTWLAKLGDWGICKQLLSPGYLGTSLTHTPVYIAPEQQEGQAHDVRLDSWQVGLLLLHIRLGWPPFFYLFHPEVGEAEREQRRSGVDLDNPASPYFNLLLPVEKEFVKACLQRNVAARPTPISLMSLRYFKGLYRCPLHRT
jgi:serine/threonine protein kinase